jgi:hypothetical protein
VLPRGRAPLGIGSLALLSNLSSLEALEKHQVAPLFFVLTLDSLKLHIDPLAFVYSPPVYCSRTASGRESLAYRIFSLSWLPIEL